MPAIRFGAGDLLEYNATYSLLICRECQYAIQKNALESHLLRHKIYRRDRQRLLSSIAQLELLEPHQVPLPVPGAPPVDALPILSGYCCTEAECRHLTASLKRMQRHWSAVHSPGGSVALASSFARPVKLQTFFRGTKVRYFEVASPTLPLLNTDEEADDDDDGDDDGDDGEDDHEGFEEEGHEATTAMPPPPPPPPMPVPPVIAHSAFPADFNLETLTYFHHFISITSLTLPNAEDPQSAKYYWQTHVVLQALRRRWLMCGLLAISAHHLAALADDIMTKQMHRERGVQFSSEFSAGSEQAIGWDLNLEPAEIEEEAKKTGEQIRCLLQCAQWELSEPTFDYESAASCQLISIMSTVRGCVVPDSLFPYSSIQNISHGGLEDFHVQEFLHPRNSSHGGNPYTNPFSDNTPSVLLNHLRALPFRISEGLGRPESTQEVLVTLSAISTVEECCSISFACDEAGAAWQGVATWLANVPDHFNEMVVCQHPAALVVLAHWAAMLVQRAEQIGCWFWKGSAKIIVLQVARQLAANGHAVLGLVECLMDIVKD